MKELLCPNYSRFTVGWARASLLSPVSLSQEREKQAGTGMLLKPSGINLKGRLQRLRASFSCSGNNTSFSPSDSETGEEHEGRTRRTGPPDPLITGRNVIIRHVRKVCPTVKRVLRTGKAQGGIAGCIYQGVPWGSIPGCIYQGVP